MRPRVFFAMMFLPTVVCALGFGQAIPVQQTFTVEQMKQMLDVSQRRGQLQMEAGMPFHLVASFQEFDENGNPTGKGKLDELWESLHQYRQTITLPEIRKVKLDDGTERFSEVLTLPPRELVEVDNETQGWRTGLWVLADPIVRTFDAALRPLYLRSTISNRLTYETVPKPTEPFDCIGTEPDLPGVADDTQLAITTYCLNKREPSDQAYRLPTASRSNSTI